MPAITEMIALEIEPEISRLSDCSRANLSIAAPTPKSRLLPGICITRPRACVRRGGLRAGKPK